MFDPYTNIWGKGGVDLSHAKGGPRNYSGSCGALMFRHY